MSEPLHTSTRETGDGDRESSPPRAAAEESAVNHAGFKIHPSGLVCEPPSRDVHRSAPVLDRRPDLSTASIRRMIDRTGRKVDLERIAAATDVTELLGWRDSQEPGEEPTPDELGAIERRLSALTPEGADRNGADGDNTGPEDQTPSTVTKSKAEVFADALNHFAARTQLTDDSGMEFSNTGKPICFDEEFWSCDLRLLDRDDKSVGAVRNYRSGAKLPRLPRGVVEFQSVFVLRSPASPTAAMAAICRAPEKWTLDCIEYIVAARLYAESVASGQEAFDAKYPHLGTALEPRPLRMDQHDTPGLGSGRTWECGAKGEEFQLLTDDDDGQESSTGIGFDSVAAEDAFLADLPIGTRVMWTTADEKADGDWGNENTMKVGQDRYIAHPHGVLSAEQVRVSMFDDGSDEQDDHADGPGHAVSDAAREYVEKYVYVSEIEWYRG